MYRVEWIKQQEREKKKLEDEKEKERGWSLINNSSTHLHLHVLKHCCETQNQRIIVVEPFSQIWK